MQKKANLYLMTFKGFSVLKSLIENDLHNFVNQVVIGEDKNIRRDYSSEIAELCKENKIPFDFYKNPIGPAEYSLAVSWKWLIRDTSNLIVFHDSLLPKYRGFAPLINQLINGETEIGVTAIFASEEYDKGDIISQEKIQIEYPITISEAIEKLSKIYSEMAVSIMKKLFVHNEKLDSKPQNEAESSYSLWRNEGDYKIDWNESAGYLKRFVDSVGEPYKGASTNMDGKKIRILSAIEIEDVKIEHRNPGKIIFLQSGFPVVVCGKGLLKITEANYENSGESIFPLKKFRIKFQ